MKTNRVLVLCMLLLLGAVHGCAQSKESSAIVEPDLQAYRNQVVMNITGTWFTNAADETQITANIVDTNRVLTGTAVVTHPSRPTLNCSVTGQRTHMVKFQFNPCDLAAFSNAYRFEGEIFTSTSIRGRFAPGFVLENITFTKQ